MNDLQRKVLLRTKYLVDKNEGAVNRVIHGGKYAEEIDAYERARAKIAKSEFALPVEEYMGKVQDISRAKDAIKESKRQKLLKALSQPVEVVEDIAENVVIEQPDILPQIKKKPRSSKGKEYEAADKKFKGREKINRSEIIEYIKKNIPKRRIIDELLKHKVQFEIEVPAVDEDGEPVLDKKGDPKREMQMFEITEKLGNELSKEDLIDALDYETEEKADEHGYYTDKIFSKSELLAIAGLNRRGEKVVGGRKIIRLGGSSGLLSKMKPTFDIAPSGPDPLLAEQAAAAKGKMPVDKSNSMDSAKKGLEAYHRFRKSYSAFPQYGDIMDRKKTMSDAFKIYKKLMNKHENDHDKAMKKLLAHVVDVSQKSGGYGVPYAKRMASLARKDTYV